MGFGPMMVPGPVFCCCSSSKQTLLFFSPHVLMQAREVGEGTARRAGEGTEGGGAGRPSPPRRETLNGRHPPPSMQTGIVVVAWWRRRQKGELGKQSRAGELPGVCVRFFLGTYIHTYIGRLLWRCALA